MHNTGEFVGYFRSLILAEQFLLENSPVTSFGIHTLLIFQTFQYINYPIKYFQKQLKFQKQKTRK